MAEAGSKLTEEQIIECLKSFNVPVRQNDLKMPSREFIIRIFECFLKDLQIDIYSPKLRSWEAISHIDALEIYEETQGLVLLVMSVNHITNPWGLNVTVKDIVEPKPKRTKKILNYILVFWNYYLQKYARFHAMKEEYEAERLKADSVINEINSLDVKHNDLLVELKNMQPSREELSSRSQVKEEKLKKLTAECAQLDSAYQALKTQEVETKNQIGETIVNICTAKEKLDELSQRILSSPDRIKTEIQKLEDRIRNEDVKIKRCENQHKEFVKKLQLQEEAEKKQAGVFSILNQIKESSNNLRDTVQSIVDVNEKISEREDKVRRLEMDLNLKKELQFQQQQKSAKVVLNTKKQVETIQDVLKRNEVEEAQLKKRIEFFKTASKKLEDDIDLKSDEILNVIEKCKEADAKSKAREIQFESKLKKMSNQFELDCKEMVEVLQSKFPYKAETQSSKTVK